MAWPGLVEKCWTTNFASFLLFDQQSNDEFSLSDYTSGSIQARNRLLHWKMRPSLRTFESPTKIDPKFEETSNFERKKSENQEHKSCCCCDKRRKIRENKNTLLTRKFLVFVLSPCLMFLHYCRWTRTVTDHLGHRDFYRSQTVHRVGQKLEITTFSRSVNTMALLPTKQHLDSSLFHIVVIFLI